MTTPDQPSVQPSAPSGRRAIWPWVAATVAALVAAVMAGVAVTLLSSWTDGPSAASSPSTGPSAAPTPSDTTDNDRWVCRSATGGDRAEPGTYVAIASVAIESTDPGIAEAGWGLLEAALVAQSAGNTFDELFEATMAIDRAKIDLAWACAARFGDGPW